MAAAHVWIHNMAVEMQHLWWCSMWCSIMSLWPPWHMYTIWLYSYSMSADGRCANTYVWVYGHCSRLGTQYGCRDAAPVMMFDDRVPHGLSMQLTRNMDHQLLYDELIYAGEVSIVDNFNKSGKAYEGVRMCARYLCVCALWYSMRVMPVCIYVRLWYTV